MCAAGNGWGRTARRLLRAGGDPDTRDDHGRTALHFAARSGSVAAIEALLAATADPTMRDNDGQTPLDMTLWPRRTEAAELLERHMPIGHGLTRITTDDG
jgi:ankyrin repeat protein